MQILLKKSNMFTLDSELFLIKKGKVFFKIVFSNGKIYNCIFKKGEIIGDFFYFFNIDLFKKFNIEFHLEIMAISDLVELEKVEFIQDFTSITYKLIQQLLKHSFINYLQVMFPKQISFLITLLSLSENGVVHKYNCNFENFHMSRSMFYHIYSTLKKEKFFSEKKEKIFLDSIKISNFFKNLSLEE